MTESLVEELLPIIEARNMLARKAETTYAIQVDDIIHKKCKDVRQIEWTLSCMLDFCFDDRVLTLYKKLCRYYYQIDPIATARYVYAYRDMWDDEYHQDQDGIPL